MKLATILISLVVGLSGRFAFAQVSVPLLDKDDVWLLVMNIPEVMEVEARKGCPDVEFNPLGSDKISVLVRNKCPDSGNGTMGVYTVDLHDGRIWYGLDANKFIDSERLQRLRTVLLSRQRLLARSGPGR